MNIWTGADRASTMPTLDDVVDKLTLFHQHVKDTEFVLKLSKAPCLKVLDIPQYKEKLTSETADCIDVEVADWLQELQFSHPCCARAEWRRQRSEETEKGRTAHLRGCH